MLYVNYVLYILYISTLYILNLPAWMDTYFGVPMTCSSAHVVFIYLHMGSLVRNAQIFVPFSENSSIFIFEWFLSLG